MRMAQAVQRWISAEPGPGGVSDAGMLKVEAAVHRKLQGDLIASMRAAGDLALAGPEDAFSPALERIQDSHAVPIVVAMLHERRNGDAWGFPYGLFFADPRVMPATQRYELSVLSRCLNEMTHPNVRRDPAVMRRLRDICEEHAIRLLDQFNTHK